MQKLEQKKPSLNIKKTLWRGIIVGLTTGSMIFPGLSTSVKAALEDSPKVVIDEVWQIVNNEYVGIDRVDWQRTRQELLSRNYSSKKEAYKAIRQSLKQLGDPYTRFLEPRQFQSLTRQTAGELFGIGVRLGLDRQTKEIVVVDTLENSPAEQGGLQKGDRIVKINGKLTSLMNIEQASEELKGKEGTDVSIELARGNEGIIEVKLTRAKIEIPTVSYALRKEDNLDIGYIKLDEFSSHAAEQMEKAIKELESKNVSGFVLDLRGNPGGLLFASVDIARMWMKEGSIVRIVDRQGGTRTFSANNSAITELPLVVLIDGNSASASEILAGALKENNRAVLVGSTTFGKGTVQSVHSLSDGSGLAVTISQYFPPSGMNINKVGIQPNFEIDLTSTQKNRLRRQPSLFGTSDDPQYSEAISVLRNTYGEQIAPSNPAISIR